MRGQKVKVSDKISTPDTPISAYLYKNVQLKHENSPLTRTFCAKLYKIKEPHDKFRRLFFRSPHLKQMKIDYSSSGSLDNSSSLCSIVLSVTSALISADIACCFGMMY